MSSRTTGGLAERGEAVGKTYACIVVQNADDVRRARRGGIPGRDIRTVHLDHVLVDTGATTLCLPAELIVALGLPLKQMVDLATAAGPRNSGLYEDARVTCEGRSSNVECIELPGGGQALLGVIPLEQLEIEVDLRNQRLRVLPDSGPQTFLSA